MGDESMTFKGLLAVMVVCGSIVACVWIIADSSLQVRAVEEGLQQDSSGHWVKSVSAETDAREASTGVHKSDCDFVPAPRLDPPSLRRPAAPAPEPIPVPFPEPSDSDAGELSPAIHRVDY